MRKRILLVFVAALALGWTCLALAATPLWRIAGEEVYACPCTTCECMNLSMKPGKCVCGKELVKSKVLSNHDSKLLLVVNGKKADYPLTAKYVCGGGPACDYKTVSQKPGKCSCGRDLVQAGK